MNNIESDEPTGTVIDRIEVSGDSFISATTVMRNMCMSDGYHFLYSDGMYLFDKLPQAAGGRDMVLLMDSNTNVAQFISRSGMGYELTAIEMREDEHGAAYVGFQLGAMRVIQPQHRSLVDDLRPYMKSDFSISEYDGTSEYGSGMMLDTHVPGLPTLFEANKTEHVFRDQRIVRAERALRWLYPLSREETIKVVVDAIEYHTNKYMLKWPLEARYAIRNIYDGHVDAMVEINHLMNVQKPPSLNRECIPPTYSTYVQQTDMIAPHIVTPWHISGAKSPIKLIATPLPWLVIARISKHDWVSSQNLQESPYFKQMYSHVREYCDVHVPVLYRGGLDTLTFGMFMSGMTKPIVSTFHSEQDHHKNFEMVMDGLQNHTWIGGHGYDPSQFARWSAYSGFRIDWVYPWVGSPRNTSRLSPQDYGLARGVRDRKISVCVGMPQFSIQRSRGGMANDTVSKQVRKYVQSVIYGDTGYMSGYPAEHVLGMFYRLITRWELDDVKRIISR